MTEKLKSLENPVFVHSFELMVDVSQWWNEQEPGCGARRATFVLNGAICSKLLYKLCLIFYNRDM